MSKHGLIDRTITYLVLKNSINNPKRGIGQTELWEQIKIAPKYRMRKRHIQELINDEILSYTEGHLLKPGKGYPNIKYFIKVFDYLDLDKNSDDFLSYIYPLLKGHKKYVDTADELMKYYLSKEIKLPIMPLKLLDFDIQNTIQKIRWTFKAFYTPEEKNVSKKALFDEIVNMYSHLLIIQKKKLNPKQRYLLNFELESILSELDQIKIKG